MSESRYDFKIIPDRIRGYFGKTYPDYQITKPNGVVVFRSTDMDQAVRIYGLLCEAFEEGKKIHDPTSSAGT